MNIECSHCHALHWKGEMRGVGDTSFRDCCQHGQVMLSPLSFPPQQLFDLYHGENSAAIEFRENIRFYNKALAFTSTGGSGRIMGELFDGNGPPSYKIQGEMFHRLGSLLPNEGTAPTYSQLYVYDPQEALRYRMLRNPRRRESTMLTLQTVLARTHPAVPAYKQAFELTRRAELPHYVIQLDLKPATDRRRYNLPSTQQELAVIIPNDSRTRANSREIIVRPRGGGLMRMSECHPAYFSLHFPLLSPSGQLSWEPQSPCNRIGRDEDVVEEAGQNRRKRKTTTLAKYVQFRSHPRPLHIESDHLFRARLLFQEWLVLTWAAIEHCRLTWVRDHQRQIRAELYSGLMDAVHEGVDASSIGRRVVLPSSITSSPRYMQKNLQDALALLRRFGGSDLFITFTANPHWPEIENALLPGQKVCDRPDLVSRVFHLKFKSFLADITETEIFGRTVGYVYTIEYQKRGLPHVHLILFLHHSARLTTPEAVNNCISTEFPDADTQPALLELVKKHMVHGPCGRPYKSPCMTSDGTCLKNFPKPFQAETTFTGDSYVKTRRRDNGIRHDVRGAPLDNRFVVSYSPFLLKKYEAHINVECTTGFQAIKYIYKVVSIRSRTSTN